MVTAPDVDPDPETWKIGLPGEHTTAHLLTRLWLPTMKMPVFLPFHQIISQLAEGQLDAGVIINESRFTYQEQGLSLHTDLGRWWQETTQLPLPLGVICVTRSLPEASRHRLAEILKKSLEYADAHPQASLNYIKNHAQESDETVLQRHIDLYVNEYTRDLGEEGVESIQYLLRQAEKLGMMPILPANLW